MLCNSFQLTKDLDTLSRTPYVHSKGMSPAVVAAEQAPSRMLRQAMWIPTKEEEHAVSTAQQVQQSSVLAEHVKLHDLHAPKHLRCSTSICNSIQINSC